MIGLQSIRHAWAVFLGRARIEATAIETDGTEELRRLFDHLTFATKLMELPMAFADDIAALDTEITNALAAKDAAAAGTVAELAAANEQIATLQGQIATNETALQALIAKYAPPAPAAVEQPAAVTG